MISLLGDSLRCGTAGRASLELEIVMGGCQTVVPNVDLVDGKCEGKRSLPPESGSEVVYSSDAKSAAVSYKALKDLVTSLVNKLPLDSASAEPSVEVVADPSHPSPSNGN